MPQSQLNLNGFEISDDVLFKGFKNVILNTHLMGRWQTLSTDPHVICDTGHNEGCFQYLSKQLQQIVDSEGALHIVFGMVRDKDISSVLALLPKNAEYFFCNAPTTRSLPANELQEMSASFGLKGEVYNSVEEAFNSALSPSVTTFVGGSNFIVSQIIGKYF